MRRPARVSSFGAALSSEEIIERMRVEAKAFLQSILDSRQSIELRPLTLETADGVTAKHEDSKDGIAGNGMHTSRRQTARACSTRQTEIRGKNSPAMAPCADGDGGLAFASANSARTEFASKPGGQEARRPLEETTLVAPPTLWLDAVCWKIPLALLRSVPPDRGGNWEYLTLSLPLGRASKVVCPER